MRSPGGAAPLHPTARLPQPRQKVPRGHFRPNVLHVVLGVGLLVTAAVIGFFVSTASEAEAANSQANLVSMTSSSTIARTAPTFESLIDADIAITASESIEILQEFPPTTTLPETTITTLPDLPIAPAVDPLERFEVLLVGDSLLAGAEQEVRLSLAPAQVTIDAEIGRGLPGSLQVFAKLGQNVGEHDIVVIELGTNDFNFPAGYEMMIAGTLATLDHARCIVWVNTQEFAGHLPELNDAILRQTARVETAFVADWASIANDPGLHLSDGYHLNEKGSRLLATLIASSVRNNCVPNRAT